jgi:SAM-dependent methyltransferase/tetratricopeptide (TPR) repeat protein
MVVVGPAPMVVSPDRRRRTAIRPLAALARRVVPRMGGRSATFALGAARPLGLGRHAARTLLREARQRLEAGEPARARELLDAVDHRVPGAVRPRRYYEVGLAEQRAGRWEEAAAAFAEAIARDSHRAGWHYRHGRALQRCRRWAEAAVAYEQAVALGDSHADAAERLARMRAKAPEWIFLSRDPDRAVTLDSVPDAAEVGVVAPLAEERITGWIPASGDGDHRILFRLNGTVVADTRATRPVTLAGGGEHLEFRRCLRDLWSHAGSGDVLEVEHAGRRLPIVGSGHQHVFSDGESRAAELFDRLDAGHAFTKYGRVRRSIQVDHEWQATMSALYTALRDDVRERFGLELFPFFGTLLGAVREQDFIGHDNDFDTIYVSDRSTPQAVRAEFMAVCGYLIDRGYSLRVKASHTWVRARGTTHKLDIFFAWFDEAGHLQTSYGHHGPPVRRSPELFRFRQQRLGTLEVPVPHNAEAVLAQLYGPGWRQPDPGFSHQSQSRILHREFQLLPEETTDLHWRQFYRDQRIDEPSSFATFVDQWLPGGRSVLEVGCGSGRDTVFLATRGHSVVGIDRCPRAIEVAGEEARRAGIADRVRLEQIDVGDRDALDRFLAAAALPDADEASGRAAGHEELAVYLRFFLHAVTEATEDALLDRLVARFPAGFRLFAEFRTVEDEALPKMHGDHYRRYLDEQRFAERLRTRWGFEIEHLEAGRGLSPYGDEDPHLARVIAAQNGTKA